MTTTIDQTSVLATRQPTKLAQLTGFSDGQINLIRQTVATGASLIEVAWYLYNAKRLGLEPTLDQIYLIKYGNNPADIVVGINGYRKQAADSGDYAGSDDPLFEYEDVGQPKGAPSKATVTVWKIVQGMRVPFTASARWTEFYPGDGKAGEQYRKRPHNQLAVRAESHALRKGFPHQTEKLERHQELPEDWREAASRFAVEREPSPERTAALSARFEQLDRDFAGEPAPIPVDDRPASTPKQQGAPRPPAEESPPSAAPAVSDDQPMVTRVRHPLSQELASLIETAAALDLDIEAFKLGLPAPVTLFEARIAEIKEAILRAEERASGADSAEQAQAF